MQHTHNLFLIKINIINMGLDFLTRFLAQFIDKFKASSPVLFVIIAALLSAVKYALDAGVFPVDPKILEWVLWVIALFTGSRTTSFLTSKPTQTNGGV